MSEDWREQSKNITAGLLRSMSETLANHQAKVIAEMFPNEQALEPDPFEVDLVDAMGDLMRSDDTACREVWSALANVIWRNAARDIEAAYSWRSAGGLIAEILGRGGYMDWYFSGQDGVVSHRIEAAMAAKGWAWRHYEK